MSMHEVNVELGKLLLLMDSHQQSKVKKRLDEIIDRFGTPMVEKWQNRTSKKNSLLHELVEYEMTEVIRHVITKKKFDINVRRATDGLTPYDLASQDRKEDICELLTELGANNDQSEEGSRWQTDEEKSKSMNIIWLDLEMTSIEEPKIMECAVIITDSDLHPLEEGNWVIHFDESTLKGLGTWHQETFADKKDGGNNLFADCRKSKLTREQVEEELLDLIKRHCPPKMCSLAGSSIHIDRRVLESEMKKVHDYLHYRIIDVSSFTAVLKRWAPWMERQIKDRLNRNGPDTVNHRAMDDIRWSISYMTELRFLFAKQAPRNANNRGQGSRGHDQQKLYRRSSSDPNAANNIKLPDINQNMTGQMELYADERRLIDRIKYERNFDGRSLRLNPERQHMYDENPHLREIFINGEPIQRFDGEFNKKDRILSSAPQQSVRNSASDPRRISTTEHWGQRKLLLCEIDFLTKYGAESDHRVIYAGAAPGIHIKYLAELFPNLEFILIDDKDFSIEEHGKIRILQKKFTNELAGSFNKFKGKILFICNVRTYSPQQYLPNMAPSEDMGDQLQWYATMKPHASLLNFRLPREPGTTQYLEGKLFIEPWASRKSAECRLIVKKEAKMVNYNNQEFEDALRYFHNVTRIKYYEHDMDDTPNEGLDHCYDCRAEIFIIQEYLKKIKNVKNGIQLKAETARMSAQISEEIVDKNRTSIIDVPRKLDVIPKRSKCSSENF